jgi:uncharacterized protein (DUF1330 family)
LIAAAAGQVVSRGTLQETVVGDGRNRPDLIAVMRIPSADTIRRFLESDEYQAHVVFRDEAFEEVCSYLAADLMNAPSDAAPTKPMT